METEDNGLAKDIKILLVEDEKFTIEVYEKLVSRYVGQVFIAMNGEEGLALYKEEKPDIVVADIMMPIMDGLEMSGLIKAINPKVQIIVSTAYMDTKMMGRAIEAGVDHYVTKPLKRKLFLSVLEKSIDAVVRHREAQNEILRLTELLTAIKQINQMIVKVESKEKLLQAICGILVKRNLYSGVWIILVDKNGIPTWGYNEGAPRKNFENMMELVKSGDAVNCFRRIGDAQETYSLIYDKSVNCDDCPLLVCTKDNYSFMVKLEHHGKLYGYFNISINEDILQKKDEFDLLMDAANDIAYSLYRFELEEISKRNEELLFHQSRLAAMGEMISMIAHQWRQPIATIGMSANNILIDMELNDMECPGAKSHLKTVQEQVMYLSKTIDDFKNFFQPNKRKRKAFLGDLIVELVKMMEKTLEAVNIELLIDKKSDREIYAYDNELVHVLINLVKNAKDELVAKQIPDAYIRVSYEVGEKDAVIEVEDNAGGIPEESLFTIFEPYFSTKGDNGTGLGLYMSEIIISKHFGGTITASNTAHGAKFRIVFPLGAMEEGL